MQRFSVLDALVAVELGRTQAKIRDVVAAAGRDGLRQEFASLVGTKRDKLLQSAHELVEAGVEVMTFRDPDYPPGLIQRGRPVAPLMFYLGRRELFAESGVGMCGSRKVSALGLRAAHACGDEVRHRGMVVISGYAAGVDTATHLAALRGGGSTVVVLAEGIRHFRVKRDFATDYDPDRVLVVSQFPPNQPWAAHAAMARNKVIYGLGRALVVIEAGERGGTLAAGEGALAVGKRVLVLNFGEETPRGNSVLLAAGAEPIGSRDELGALLRRFSQDEFVQPKLDI